MNQHMKIAQNIAWLSKNNYSITVSYCYKHMYCMCACFIYSDIYIYIYNIWYMQYHYISVYDSTIYIISV